MKAQVWALIMVLTLAGVRLLAQETTPAVEYRLHMPTAEDYLALIEDLVTIPTPNYELSRIVLDDLQAFNRLPEDLPYNQIMPIYRGLLATELSNYGVNHDVWVSRLVAAWLNEHPGELETSERIVFEDFTLDVQEVDFHLDGQPEYILSIYRDLQEQGSYWQAAYDSYMIASVDREGVYHVTPTPMTYNLAYMTWQRDSWQTLSLEDLNDDGQIEWAVVGYGHNTGPGARSRGTVLVLRWNGEQLVNLAPNEIGFHNDAQDSASWSFVNVDEDTAQEIVQTQTHNNSWNCQFETVMTFDWDALQDTYVVAETHDVLPDTYGCVVSQAEAAMWNEDFDTAIPLYERAITFAEDAQLPDYFLEQHQYTQARYALAFALDNQPEAALTMLHDLQSTTPASEGISDMIDLMAESYEPEQDELALCTALYNFFVPYWRDYSGGGYYSPVNAYVGFTLIDSEMFVMDAYTPHPANSGCDVDWLIASRLNGQSFAVNMPPTEVFERANIPLTAQRSFDLNQDEIDDWLLWIEAEVKPFFFISNDSTGQYDVLRPELPVIGERTTHHVFELPDNSGNALAWLSFDITPHFAYGFCPTTEDIGLLTVWRLQASELRTIFTVGACEQRSWEQIFQENGREIHAWTQVGDGPGGDLIDAVYTWNPQEQRYLLTDPPPEFWAARVEQYNSEFGAFEIDAAASNLRSALLSSESLGETLAILDEELAGDVSEIDAQLIPRSRYYRALALEALNRPDEALAEYIAIYEAAPESAWGMLAALHLERVE